MFQINVSYPNLLVFRVYLNINFCVMKEQILIYGMVSWYATNEQQVIKRIWFRAAVGVPCLLFSSKCFTYPQNMVSVLVEKVILKFAVCEFRKLIMAKSQQYYAISCHSHTQSVS